MDKNGSHKLQIRSTTWFNRDRRFTKLFVSVSLVSFLVSYSSALCQLFHFLSACYLELVLPLFEQTFDRKYMFLICNGIVAFLATNSSFSKPQKIERKEAPFEISTPSLRNTATTEKPQDIDEKGLLKTEEERRETPSLENVASTEKQQDIEEKPQMIEHKEAPLEISTPSLENIASTEKRQDIEEKGLLTAEEEGRETPSLENVACIEKQEDRQGNVFLETEEEEEEEGLKERVSLVPPSLAEEVERHEESIQELNRKFEEFIRKMKEEIRLGAQSQRQVRMVVV